MLELAAVQIAAEEIAAAHAAANRTATSQAAAMQAAATTGGEWSSATASLLRGAVRPSLVAQPIVDLAARNLAGFELLARFSGPPSAPPDVWFALADRLGHAAALTARVLEQALDLRETLPPDTFLTVNIEPHLLTEPEVTEVLRGQALDRMVLELTEHTRAHDEEALTRALVRVREAGGLVAIDDAGTGYAGLQQLLTIRPDIVKLDRALVGGLDSDPIRRALVELLGNLSGRMDAWLLAEGVETAGELQSLVALGVPLAQGWLLGRPAQPWSEVAADTAETLRLMTEQVARNDHVAALMRSCPTARLGEHAGARPGTVLLDATDRPVAVVAADLVGGTAVVPAMTVAPDSPPADVARRAFAREVPFRGVPVVCTDVRGQLIGVIDTVDLLEAAIRGAG